jgi:catechol 2,3-dioxygenase-like lactoylglutathione lyase family enzyme
MGALRVASVTIDCPDPRALSEFYAQLLGWPSDPEPAPHNFFAELTNPAGSIGLSFQRVDGYRAPEWPGQDVPQQVHLSLVADDVGAAHERAMQLGARLLSGDAEPRVYADPAGHPFCISAGLAGLGSPPMA